MSKKVSDYNFSKAVGGWYISFFRGVERCYNPKVSSPVIE
jgi:hypothetical protein